MTDPKDGLNRGGNPATQRLAEKIVKHCDDHGEHTTCDCSEFIESLLAEALEEHHKSVCPLGHWDYSADKAKVVAEAYDRAAEVAEHEKSCPVITDDEGDQVLGDYQMCTCDRNKIAERIRALKS